MQMRLRELLGDECYEQLRRLLHESRGTLQEAR